MYIFVFLWTPVLEASAAPHHLPHGLVFALFMISIMIGSNLFTNTEDSEDERNPRGNEPFVDQIDSSRDPIRLLTKCAESNVDGVKGCSNFIATTMKKMHAEPRYVNGFGLLSSFRSVLSSVRTPLASSFLL